MTEMPSTYQGTVLSARSRRLRTIGILLLIAVIGMTLYGRFALMPPINRAASRLAQEEHQQEAAAQAAFSSAYPNGFAGMSAPQPSPHLASARHKLRVQVAAAYAYWGVCALLLIGVLFVAWLDLREISRNYLNQRRAIWSEATTREILARGPSSEE